MYSRDNIPLYFQFINPTDNYKFTMVGGLGYASELYFKFHSDPKFRRMYKFMSKYFVSSEDEGIRKLANG